MGLVRDIEIISLNCINAAKGIDICPFDTAKSSIQGLKIPELGQETTLVQIAPGTVDDLFVHHYQTDQLLVVKGSAVLVILQQGCYRYILLTEHYPQIVKIPPGIPHGAVNLSSEPCLVVNSLIRHGAPNERDYRPLKMPFPYDLSIVQTLQDEVTEKRRQASCH